MKVYGWYWRSNQRINADPSAAAQPRADYARRFLGILPTPFTALHPGWLERMHDTYGHELDAFINALETGTPPRPSLLDGLKAQLIAEAAVESQQLGRPVPILTE